MGSILVNLGIKEKLSFIKDTKEVISTSTIPYSLDLINNGIQSNGKKIFIGGDINGVNNGYTYQANEHLKFYDFYIITLKIVNKI